MHRGHGVADEGFVDGGCGLYVGGDNHSMLSEVEEEGISGPSTLGFHDVERHAPEKVFECGADSDTVALQWFEAGGAGSFAYPLKEFHLGERAACILGSVREEV